MLAIQNTETLPSRKNILTEAIFDRAFWRELAPTLTIEGGQTPSILEFSDKEKQQYKENLTSEGYIHVKGSKLNTPYADMARAYGALVQHGLPPVFSFVFDEAWAVSAQLRYLLGGILHSKYKMLPDFWAWHVSPGQAGWTPHRDKSKGISLFRDGTSKSVTVWIPVTEAHPLNGCMYILPANRDKLYGSADATTPQIVLQDIRALPAKPGDILMWTQEVLHWGGHSADAHDLPPRMSMAFEFQRSDVPAFREPLLDPSVAPDFDRRLALIAKQVLQYRHMYSFSEELAAAAENILSRSKPLT